jgi:chemotaxis response regulator CheB
MAYVYAQHLEPGHGSRLVEILSKRATWPVEEAREGLKILPEHLYVIVPKRCIQNRIGLQNAVGVTVRRFGQRTQRLKCQVRPICPQVCQEQDYS